MTMFYTIKNNLFEGWLHVLFLYPADSELFLAYSKHPNACWSMETSKHTFTGLTQAKEQGIAWAGSLV